MTQNDILLKRCRKMITEGADTETVLGVLRASGYSKVHSIKALVDLDLATLNNAKEIVHKSATWHDVRARDEDFHDDIGDV